MNLVCLDLEGVLVPEIWLNVAAKTGIEALNRTTRDEPDYSKLMAGRIDILHAHNLGLADIQGVISTMDPMPGALEFLNQLRSHTQVVILSDTFEQFAQPLMKKLEWPTLFCNKLVVNPDGIIVDFKLRQQDGKKKAVAGFQSMGLRVTAAGDSYNDLTMIKGADRGALFRPPASIIKEQPHLPVFHEYQEFYAFLVESE